MSDVLDFFRQHLRRSGRRSTREHALILGVAISSQGSFTADHLIQMLQPLEADFIISREVVCGTLAELEECGLLKRQSWSDGCEEYCPNLLLISELTMDKPPRLHGRFTELCSTVHETLICGVCPWCGRPVMDP